ncbi:MAG: hypothetical protein ACRDQH_15040 [Pseudonocardiaceae bacterium]
MSSATVDNDINTIMVARDPIMVDPDTAAQWLTRNRSNRGIRRSQVNKYAGDMTAGRWCLTGAPVQFALDGRLLDGQHRLMAIVQSGVAVPLYVVRGLPVEAQGYMDTGAKRTVADQLKLSGYENVSIVAAAARLALMWRTDRLNHSRNSMSDQEIRGFIEENPDLIDAASLANRVRHAGLNVPTGGLCAAIWAMIDKGHDPDRIMEFFMAAAENRTAGPGDPKHALLRRLNTGRDNRERMRSEELLSLLIRTYNADYLRKPMNKVQVFVRGSVMEVPAVVAPVHQGTP